MELEYLELLIEDVGIDEVVQQTIINADCNIATLLYSYYYNEVKDNLLLESMVIMERLVKTVEVEQ